MTINVPAPALILPSHDPALFFDCTTTFAERGRIAHGTTRVERSLLRALLDLEHPAIAFCRFVRSQHAMLRVPPAELRAALDAPATPDPRRQARPTWRNSAPLRLGKKLERAVRVRLRDQLWWQFALRTRSFTQCFPAGSTLVVSGEMRHNLELLWRMIVNSELRFAAVHYDVVDQAWDNANRTPEAIAARATLEFVLRTADLILPISHHSASLLKKYVETHGQRLPPYRVLPLGHDLPVDDAMAAPVPGLEPDKFVLTVGDLSHRKNQGMLIDIWRALVDSRNDDLPILVCAGRVGHEETGVHQTIVNNARLRSAITVLSDVGDRRLAWLYRNCRFTLFPSRNEGYGLPVAESLAFGKLCVASFAGAIIEAGQGLALHLDPDDQDSWHRTIVRLLDDKVALDTAEQRIRSEYRPMTWRDAAMYALDVMTQHQIVPRGRTE